MMAPGKRKARPINKLASSPTQPVVEPRPWNSIVIPKVKTLATGPIEKPTNIIGTKEKSNFSHGAKKARGISGK